MPPAKNKEFNWQDTGEKISMGEKVGKFLTDLRDTACLHIDEREIISIMKMYITMFPDDKEFNSFLTTRAIPAFKQLGFGKWYRDVITDLALALASKKEKKDSRVSAKNILTV